MNQKTVVIALVDKAWPPRHSFVDGMLAGEAAREADIRLRLCVSFARADDIQPRRYKSATCLPGLYPRRGSGRTRNLLAALKLLRYQIRREQGRGNRIVLFVRNDPIYLLAASLLRAQVDRLVFQSSFPHEEYSGHAIKRGVARLLYRLAGRGVDVVTGVSPEGVARAQRLCPAAEAGSHIPLLADLPAPDQGLSRDINPDSGPVFVYIGTHGPGREMETVLGSIVGAVAQGAVGRFRFIGASEEDEIRLRKVGGIENLIERGIVRFERPVPRHDIPRILADCDIGLSLIPPKPVYYESSPTKLAEYMGADLVVMASRGIPMQERFVMESNGGLLVDWDVVAIAEGILTLCADPAAINTYRQNAATYAGRSLQYRVYLPQFRQLLGLP